MIFDGLGWSLMIFRNPDFLMILPDFVKCTTWRRVLRTPSLYKRECPKFVIWLHMCFGVLVLCYLHDTGAIQGSSQHNKSCMGTETHLLLTYNCSCFLKILFALGTISIFVMML